MPPWLSFSVVYGQERSELDHAPFILRYYPSKLTRRLDTQPMSKLDCTHSDGYGGHAR